MQISDITIVKTNWTKGWLEYIYFELKERHYHFAIQVREREEIVEISYHKTSESGQMLAPLYMFDPDITGVFEKIRNEYVNELKRDSHFRLEFLFHEKKIEVSK